MDCSCTTDRLVLCTCLLSVFTHRPTASGCSPVCPCLEEHLLEQPQKCGLTQRTDSHHALAHFQKSAIGPHPVTAFLRALEGSHGRIPASVVDRRRSCPSVLRNASRDFFEDSRSFAWHIVQTCVMHILTFRNHASVHCPWLFPSCVFRKASMSTSSEHPR